MNESMCRVQRGSFVYYTCRRIPVRHAFTTKFGGVSTGACESLNLGFNRGDELENVRENYRLLGETLGVDETRMTLTKQIHDTQVSVVTEDKVGMGLHRPMEWQSDAIVTALPDTPIIGFYADCVVTLLYDPATNTAGVCHSGWRGMAAGILPKTVDVMAEQLGTKRESLIAVLGPSIRQECFETLLLQPPFCGQLRQQPHAPWLRLYDGHSPWQQPRQQLSCEPDGVRTGIKIMQRIRGYFLKKKK